MSGFNSPGISSGLFYSTPIPLPPIEEQVEIVALIKAFENDDFSGINPSGLDLIVSRVYQVHKCQESCLHLKDELTHQLSLVKQLRQAFLREAMQGKLVSQDPNDEPASELLKKIKAEKEQLIKQKKIKKEKELPPIKPEEIPFEIPKSWVWCRLGEVALYSQAGTSFKCEEIPIAENQWGVIKVSAVSWDNFSENENKLYSRSRPSDTSAKIEVGDFLISRANTSELVGKSVVVKAISKNLLLSDKTIRFVFSEFVSVDYVNRWNNAEFPRKYYATQGTGSSPSMKNITREHMNNLLVPIPPLTQQHRIVAKLEHLINLCVELEQSIKKNQMQNEQLLQQVLREALQPSKKFELREALSIVAEQ
jgi:type I restriction enzyme S subunit